MVCLMILEVVAATMCLKYHLIPSYAELRLGDPHNLVGNESNIITK